RLITPVAVLPQYISQPPFGSTVPTTEASDNVATSSITQAKIPLFSFSVPPSTSQGPLPFATEEELDTFVDQCCETYRYPYNRLVNDKCTLDDYNNYFHPHWFLYNPAN
ncbi:unnamed protein product, partial [Allacma fusca]